MLRKYTVTTNQFFTVRTRSWFKLVLQQGLHITDYWYRFEFAKSRGAIHFHALLYGSKLIHGSLRSLLDRCIDAANLTILNNIKSTAAEEITTFFKGNLVNITALHPSGRVRSSPETPCDTVWYKTRLRIAKYDELNQKVVSHLKE